MLIFEGRLDASGTQGRDEERARDVPLRVVLIGLFLTPRKFYAHAIYVRPLL